MENWRSVVGYEGLYEVSDIGRVRSIDRYVSQINNGTITDRLYQGRILKMKKESNGYLSIKLCNQENTKYKKIHRLVAEAFIPNQNKKPLINHKNGIKQDNRVSNLEWCTIKENSEHALKTGLHNPIITEQCKKSSIEASCKRIVCLNNGIEFKSSYDAAIWLNNEVFSNTKKVHTISARIRNVCAGDRNHCYGYKFQKIN